MIMAGNDLLPVIQQPMPSPAIEGIARVVAMADNTLWLEPEQTTSCGHCSASASCATGTREAAGMGTVTSRLQARRFRMDVPGGAGEFRVGDRLVVGVSEKALLSGSMTAYGLPLLTALVAGSVTQALYGDDAATMIGMVGGLAVGLLGAGVIARMLGARGDLAPRFLRRARADETCATN